MARKPQEHKWLHEAVAPDSDDVTLKELMMGSTNKLEAISERILLAMAYSDAATTAVDEISKFFLFHGTDIEAMKAARSASTGVNQALYKSLSHDCNMKRQHLQSLYSAGCAAQIVADSIQKVVSELLETFDDDDV